MRIHFIGIGGVGVSALGEVALARGDRVTGSDRSASPITARLAAHGAGVTIGHCADAVRAAAPDLVVYSAAISDANPELAVAREAGIPVMSRAQYLGRLMDEAAGPTGAIGGSHGKTTTTCMLASALVAADLDPTALIGGDYAPFDGNVRIGAGPFVTEACEAFRSFLELRPDVAIVTSVDADHLDCYGTLDGVIAGFLDFVGGVRPGGTVVVCREGPNVDIVAARAAALGLQVVTYGFASHLIASVSPTITAEHYTDEAGVASADIVLSGKDGRSVPVGRVVLGMPGRHNILNGLAALGAAIACGADPAKALQGLQGFGGVERRFQVLGERNGVVVVDDYCHHPTEIAATIAAARSAYPGRRLIAVFQPHLYSRTRDHLDDFATTLAEADAVIVAGIYAAREEPIEGVDASLLSGRISRLAPGRTVLTEPDKARIPAMLAIVARPGDVALIMGAGDIREAGEWFLGIRARSD